MRRACGEAWACMAAATTASATKSAAGVASHSSTHAPGSVSESNTTRIPSDLPLSPTPMVITSSGRGCTPPPLLPPPTLLPPPAGGVELLPPSAPWRDCSSSAPAREVAEMSANKRRSKDSSTAGLHEKGTWSRWPTPARCRGAYCGNSSGATNVNPKSLATSTASEIDALPPLRSSAPWSASLPTALALFWRANRRDTAPLMHASCVNPFTSSVTFGGAKMATLSVHTLVLSTKWCLNCSIVFFSPCTSTMLAGRTRLMKSKFSLPSTCAAKLISCTAQFKGLGWPSGPVMVLFPPPRLVSSRAGHPSGRKPVSTTPLRGLSHHLPSSFPLSPPSSVPGVAITTQGRLPSK
mmetsp:Transcript_72865/g.146706  ORF Transcript_72865/g.146706 Transcript_72865/m.146706 type:complete len:352 (-) Transcript_72865:98-1153(-)